VILLAAKKDCSSPEPHIEASPDVEGAAPESHIAATSDSAEICDLKPPRRLAAYDQFHVTTIAVMQSLQDRTVNIVNEREYPPRDRHHARIAKLCSQSGQPERIGYLVIVDEGHYIGPALVNSTVASAT
jgi:hypothetical protein